jgi:hypothetical protein
LFDICLWSQLASSGRQCLSPLHRESYPRHDLGENLCRELSSARAGLTNKELPYLSRSRVTLYVILQAGRAGAPDLRGRHFSLCCSGRRRDPKIWEWRGGETYPRFAPNLPYLYTYPVCWAALFCIFFALVLSVGFGFYINRFISIYVY